MVEVTVLLKGFSFGCLGECNQSRVFDAPEFANLLGDYENFHLTQAISPSTHGSVMSVDHKDVEFVSTLPRDDDSRVLPLGNR
jgi:hypothetical protein